VAGRRKKKAIGFPNELGLRLVPLIRPQKVTAAGIAHKCKKLSALKNNNSSRA